MLGYKGQIQLQQSMRKTLDKIRGEMLPTAQETSLV